MTEGEEMGRFQYDWVKIAVELPDDDKFVGRKDKWGDIGKWVAMLCKAQNSPVRGSLYLTMSRPVTPEWLASYFGITLDEVNELLSFLQTNEMIEHDEQGGITLLHFFDRQYDKPSDQPGATSGRKKESRQCHANVTPSSRQCHATDTDTDTDTEVTNMCVPPRTHASVKHQKNEYSQEFEEFWSAYPRHMVKTAAWKCWQTRSKEGHTAEDMTTAATHYAEVCRQQGRPQDKIMHPATFLGPNKPFLDYIKPPEEQTFTVG